ncbi:chorismate mutase [Domibacillus epiphyticus]|uniref:chorismate mutase n=1 Tax=Domibacillus epiphyticus TaxID=1714355 RepID=A0A1V2A4K2_9BACI|nr:chorismate mutase [Domibacillus epiphyticus]OMP65860.1 chorismate mutase [Domibacillus epiphyticus]
MVRGIRGAVTVEQNNSAEMVQATERLIAEMIEKNNIDPETVCSAFISATDDLDAMFPARALRELKGWEYVPVMCMQELAINGGLEKCIRIMMHVNTDKAQKDIQHVYLDGAVVLRPDLQQSTK